MEVIRLERKKESTRALYAEAFRRTSARARDYYETRMRENAVYVIRNEEVEGMLCLNPCRVRFDDKDWDLSYIVAVATRKKYREKDGVMRRILTTALLDEYAEKALCLFEALKSSTTPFQFACLKTRKAHIEERCALPLQARGCRG